MGVKFTRDTEYHLHNPSWVDRVKVVVPFRQPVTTRSDFGTSQ